MNLVAPVANALLRLGSDMTVTKALDTSSNQALGSFQNAVSDHLCWLTKPLHPILTLSLTMKPCLMSNTSTNGCKRRQLRSKVWKRTRPGLKRQKKTPSLGFYQAHGFSDANGHLTVK